MRSTNGLILSATVAALALVLSNCGCGGASANMQLLIRVSLSQTTATVQAGATAQFTATVNNDSTGKGVTWSVTCSAPECGSVSPTATASGVATTYTAPTPAPASDLKVTLTATSVADPTKSIPATITVPGVAAPITIGVAVSPVSVLLPGGTTQSFTASVSNDPTNSGVTWALTVNGTACAATACGTLSSTNANPVNYGAPATLSAPAAVTLTATSVTDTTKSATAAVNLTFGTVKIAPDLLPFELVAVGQSEGLATTLTNTASTPLRIASITVTGSNVSDFSQTNNCGTGLAVGGSCSILATFTPKSVGSLSAKVAISDDSSDSPQQISLVGYGNLPHFTALAMRSTQDRNSTVPAPQYFVVKLGSLGGTVGRSNGVNGRGWVSGWSNLAGDNNHHAVLWIDGNPSNLGTLGGQNSEIEFTAKNNFGLLAGGSDTSNIDPYGENFCAFTATDNLLCSAFQWQNGVMSPLPGLGGNNSYATGSNRSGRIVGWAETPTIDSNCLAPQVFDWHGALWKDGQIQALRPIPGDTMSGALAINDLGVAAGGSGDCGSPGVQGFALSTHAVIWREGSPIDLGSLGGRMNNVATAINNLGQVAGFSDLPGDAIAHAFLWQDGVMTDLGTLPGDTFSVAWSIGEGGQVLGQSCDANGNCRGFLWQDGVMTDLNTLTPGGSPLFIIDANDMNSGGKITGQAFDPLTGEMPAIEMIPCTLADDPGCKSEAQGNVRIDLPQYVRNALQKRRLHFRK
jgi:probable HAF family extracellular repeat protein